MLTETAATTSLHPVVSQFAGYVLEGVAGRGGMGVVYRARESFPDRVVALKVLSPELAADNEFRARFVRESNLAATIEHPNVLPIFRAGEEHGLLYLAMRYVEGTDLAALIAARGRIEPTEAIEIVAAVCDALDAAHAQGLVHRDVKPANVLLGRQGGRDHVYLADFGIAKGAGASEGPTATGSFLGTLDYAAPEQIRSGHVDARTDVYAAGCLLFHAISGRVPFPAESAAARVFAHLSADPPSLTEVDPDMAAALDPVIAKAMAKDPAARYASAGELARAARDAMHVPAGPVVVTEKKRSWRRKLVTLALVVALLAGGGGAYAVFRHDHSGRARFVRAANRAATLIQPRGQYKLSVAADWAAQPKLLGRKFDLWQVAPSVDGFAPNVNVFVEAALGRDLKTYVDQSVLAGSGSPGYVLRSRSRARGTSGNPLAIVETTNVINGHVLRYLMVTAEGAGHFVTATLTAPDDRFAGIRAVVEPRLRTLRAI